MTLTLISSHHAPPSLQLGLLEELYNTICKYSLIWYRFVLYSPIYSQIYQNKEQKKLNIDPFFLKFFLHKSNKLLLFCFFNLNNKNGKRCTNLLYVIKYTTQTFRHFCHFYHFLPSFSTFLFLFFFFFFLTFANSV